MKYFYARVSTKEQNLDRQIEFAKTHYPEIEQSNIYCDKQSGKNFNRENYSALKAILQEGDELIVKELDRLGRNKDAIKEELKYFKEHKIIVRILDVPTTLIDFQGNEWLLDMVNNILIEVMGAIAEQERIKTKTRQAEGIQAMKDRGEWDKYGRPKKEIENFEYYLEQVRQGKMSICQACKELHIGKGTWYNKVKEVV